MENALELTEEKSKVEMEAHYWERAFLEHCEQMRKKQDWTKTELARKAFGQSKGESYRAYCRLLQVKKRAKPKRLTLHDAFMLALLWYPTFESCAFAVSEMVKTKLADGQQFI